MIGAVIENFIGGYLHPRASVRRLLAGGHGNEVTFQLFLLAYLLRQILFLAMPGMRAEFGGGFAWYLGQLFEMGIVFALLSGATYGVGRLFGGKATLEQAAQVMAWYLVVTAIIDPLLAAAWMKVRAAAEMAAANPGMTVELPGGATLTMVTLGSLAMWLLASYVAELHRFRSTWAVLAVILGLSFFFGLIAGSLVPGG